MRVRVRVRLRVRVRMRVRMRVEMWVRVRVGRAATVWCRLAWLHAMHVLMRCGAPAAAFAMK